jgi:hypothetical protein
MASIDESPKTTNRRPDSPRATVAVGAPLKATLVWRDPPGTVNSQVHRTNDLDLVVNSPSGRKYYGNDGMHSGHWTTPDGGNIDDRNTVENVFAEEAEAGDWEINVVATDVNTDGVPGTAGVESAFALVVTGVAGGGSPLMAPDLNRDGVTNLGDLEAFLSRYAAGRADVNRDGRTDPVDVAAFVGAWLGQVCGEREKGAKP